MNRFTKIASMLSFALVLALTSCSEDSTSNTPSEFVADDNTFKGFTSWVLEATKSGPDPSLGEAHAGNDASVTRKIYIKDGKSRVNGQYPIGTLVVKHTSNPAGTVNEYTAMVKRGNNFNASGGDWEWFVINADGTIRSDGSNKLRGANLMNGMCVGCHGKANTKDYVFSKN